MKQLRGMPPEDLTEAQRALYDDIVATRAAASPVPLLDDSGALTGPFNAMLLSPDLGTALQRLGSAIRHQTGLPARVRELAIVCVAAHWSSDFEWQSHAPLAAAAGVSEVALAQLREGLPPTFDEDRDAEVHVVVQQLIAGQAPTPDKGFAPAELFELSTLVGYYATLALQLRVFGIDGSA